MKKLLILTSLLISGGLWAEENTFSLEEFLSSEPPPPSLLTHGLKCDSSNPSYTGPAPKLVYIFPYGTYPFGISIFKKTDDSGWNNYYTTCLNPKNENEYFLRNTGKDSKSCKSSFRGKEIVLDRTTLELVFKKAFEVNEGHYSWKYRCSLMPKKEIEESVEEIQAQEKKNRKI